MGLLNSLVVPHGKLGPAIRQMIQLGFTNAEIAKALERNATHVAKERSVFNAMQPVGERWSAKGYKFGMPLAGLSMMGREED